MTRLSGGAQALFCAAVTVAGACGAGESGATVRDSLGIAVVDNREPAGPGGHAWRVAESPRLDIGLMEGDPNYQLYRVAGAVKLDDGRIVVANSGTGELRFFDANGDFVRSAGRRGGGPGEFESMWTIGRYRGDSLAVYDWRLGRISVFDTHGDFGRTYRLVVDQRATLLGLFADGHVLAAVPSPAEDLATGVRRSFAEYVRLSPDGAPVQRLGRFLENEFFVRTSGEMVGTTGLAFGKQGLAAAHEDRFFAGSTERYEIQVYDTLGALQRVIRRNVEPTPVGDEDMAAYRNTAIESRSDRSRLQALLDMIDAMPVPEAMPVFEELRVDREGNLWVADYRRPGDDRPPFWTVFDADGRMVGDVETPAGFRIFEIGSDYLLGRGRDQWDAEHVRVYELVKP